MNRPFASWRACRAARACGRVPNWWYPAYATARSDAKAVGGRLDREAGPEPASVHQRFPATPRERLPARAIRRVAAAELVGDQLERGRAAQMRQPRLKRRLDMLARRSRSPRRAAVDMPAVAMVNPPGTAADSEASHGPSAHATVP
jgi:hypothetical protein